MKIKFEKALFIIDSPLNAFMANIIGQKFENITMIYCLDSNLKNNDQKEQIIDLLLKNLKIKRVYKISYDAKLFWSGGKNLILPNIRKEVKKIIDSLEGKFIYYGNCLTNPVALALSKYKKLNHLYHSPTDFFDMLFNKKDIKFYMRFYLKKLLFLEHGHIQKGDHKILSLINFKDDKNFQFIDYSLLNQIKLKNTL